MKQKSSTPSTGHATKLRIAVNTKEVRRLQKLKGFRIFVHSIRRPKTYKGLYGILQLLQGSHLDNFPQKTLKLGRVAIHSLTCQF